MTIVRRPKAAMGLFALIALGVSTPAFAASDVIIMHEVEPGTITRTTTIDISDISLASAQGRRTLESRITRAARKVCDYNGVYGLDQPAGFKECFTEARSNALSQARVVQTASR